MTSRNRRERRAGIALALSLLTLIPFAAGAARAEEPVQPQPLPQPITLRQALRRALEANASTATARSQVATSEAQVRQLRTSILPHLDLDSAVTRNSREVAFDVNGFRATLLPRNDWSARLNFSQPIYAGQRETMALRQGRLSVTSNQAAVRTAEDMVLLSTASNYLGIVQGQDLVNVEQKNLELAARRRKQAQAFYEAGEQTKVDVLRADTDAKAAERALVAAQQSRDLAASRLRLDLALDQLPGTSIQSIQVQPPDLRFPPLPAADFLGFQPRDEAIQPASSAAGARLPRPSAARRSSSRTRRSIRPRCRTTRTSPASPPATTASPSTTTSPSPSARSR